MTLRSLFDDIFPGILSAPAAPKATQKTARASKKAQAKTPDASGLSSVEPFSGEPLRRRNATSSSFFQDDPPPEKQRIDEKNAKRKHANIKRLVLRQTYVIMALTFVVILLIPISQPIHKHIAIRPDKKSRPLPALYAPNNTDQAVLSWAVSSITEVMTFGFGDIDERILGQQHRFTDKGWDSFLKAIYDGGMYDEFKARQLVVTTVPSDAPVITSKGLNEDKKYQWLVEMPVIMTYTTNNNKKDKHKGIVKLTLVAVPTSKNVKGIGIDRWFFR